MSALVSGLEGPLDQEFFKERIRSGRKSDLVCGKDCVDKLAVQFSFQQCY
jgi:hypothetical protein